MDADQVRETEAYTLGVQAVLWGMQWVKAGQAFRLFSRPLPVGEARSPYDQNPHGINIWGHAQKLLNADFRTIETPNTETLYAVALLDLKDSPMVVVHPDYGDRSCRTSIWDLHSDTHTISQKQDGSHPPSYAIIPVGWQGSPCLCGDTPRALPEKSPTRKAGVMLAEGGWTCPYAAEQSARTPATRPGLRPPGQK
jgi:hypothetical protein